MRFYDPLPARIERAEFVVPVPVDPTGRSGPTRGQAAGAGWRGTSPGLYVPASVDARLPEQRIVEAATRFSSRGLLTGWAVLRLAQCRYFDGLHGNVRLPVRLQLGPHNGRRRRAGLHLLYDDLRPGSDIRGLRCVSRPWAVFDELRAAGDLVRATTVVDMALHNRFISLPEMQSFVDGQVGVTGVPLAREVLAHADEHAASPQETRLRLFWEVELGLPRPWVNVAILTRDGRLVGYPDLFDEEAGLAIEYDGEDHRRAQRHSDDVDREAAFREAGVEVTRVTNGDLRQKTRLRQRLLAARGRARFEPPERRRWRLE